jgi:hypothetical protein
LNSKNIEPWNLNVEHKLHVIPRLQHIRNHYPKIKITEIDVSDSVMKSLDGKDEDWVLDQRDNLTMYNKSVTSAGYFKEIQKQFDKDLKICAIVGVEKPKTFIKNGMFYLRFTDSAANTRSRIVDHSYTNVKVEYFYWNDPIMVAKQAHVIKHWLEMNPNFQPRWQHNTPEVITRRYQEKWLRSILYTTWDKNWYQTDKNIYGWYSTYDRWFHEHMKNEKTYSTWKQGLDYLSKAASNFIVFKNDSANGLKPFSHTYKIGTIKYRP